MRIVRALSLLAAPVALALGTAGCGVPTTAGPRALSQDIIPGNGSATSTTAPQDVLAVPIILIDTLNGNAPAAVDRGTSLQADHLADVLNLLLEGPSTGDLSKGLTTAIPFETRLLGLPNPNVTVNPATAPSGPITVNLSQEFTLAVGSDALLEVEQIVYTISCAVTPTTGEAKVLFEVDGGPQAVPLGNGTATTAPVTALDYNGGQPPSCLSTP